MKKVAVILSGCGHRDGSEITEAVSALIALDQKGVSYQTFAPDIEFVPTNHLNGDAGDPEKEHRNTRLESARISRGQTLPLGKLNVDSFDALVFPGGYGAALHLCDWANKGSKCQVHPEIENIILKFYRSQKPIGAICIAPALIAKVLGSEKITVTVGAAGEASTEIEKTGALHEECAVTEFVSDREHRIVSTPAYMYDYAKPFEVFTGIQKAMAELVEMA